MLEKLGNVYNTIGKAQAQLERVNHKLGRLTAAWRGEADEFGYGTPPEKQPTIEEMGGLYSFADLLASHTEALKHEVGRFAEYVSAYNGRRLDMGVTHGRRVSGARAPATAGALALTHSRERVAVCAAKLTPHNPLGRRSLERRTTP